MRNQKGFSLIELLLVVAVILIISAIAVPSFLRSRMRAHEANTVAALRVIVTGAIAYSSAYPNLGYAAPLTNLGGANPCTPAPGQACLEDDNLDTRLNGGDSAQFRGSGST